MKVIMEFEIDNVEPSEITMENAHAFGMGKLMTGVLDNTSRIISVRYFQDKDEVDDGDVDGSL